jgi:hypothetical protein
MYRSLTPVNFVVAAASAPIYTTQIIMLSSKAAVVVTLALACLVAPGQAISWPFSKRSRTLQETMLPCTPSTEAGYVCTLALADGVTFNYAVDAKNLYGKMDVSNAYSALIVELFTMRDLHAAVCCEVCYYANTVAWLQLSLPAIEFADLYCVHTPP